MIPTKQCPEVVCSGYLRDGGVVLHADGCRKLMMTGDVARRTHSLSPECERSYRQVNGLRVSKSPPSATANNKDLTGPGDKTIFPGMSNERRSHECSACDGIGSVDGPCDECPNKHGYVECAVCLGSGRIPEPTDTELRLDAMADAETLRLLWESRNRSVATYTDARPCFQVQYPVIRSEDEDFWRSRHAARAAFRACPGLRGDR